MKTFFVKNTANNLVMRGFVSCNIDLADFETAAFNDIERCSNASGLVK